MKFFNSSLLLLLLPSFVTARVGTQSDVALMNAQDMQAEDSRLLQALCTQCKTISVAYHLLQDSALAGDTATLWTDEQIAEEIIFVNNQWANTPFIFELRADDGIDRQARNDWNQADLTDANQLNPIATQLRVGGPTTVNVFVNDGNVCATSGWATQDLNTNMFPVDEFVRTDRISICGDSPSSRHTFITSHELGHWLGLKHTYENGCSGENDGIDDTPAQAAATTGCPENADTCPGFEGLDLVNNFMDLSGCPDKEFTAGQIQLMYNNYVEFREKSVPCDPEEAQLGFDIMFDNDAWQNMIIITKWGEGNQNFQIMDPNVNYANKQALHNICFPRNTMYEVKLTDAGNNGLTAPAYFAYSLNGEEIFRGAEFTGSESILVAGGSQICGPNQGRFMLMMEFDSRPNDILWQIKDSSGTVVVDQTATTSVNRDTYITNFIGSLLIFDQCLDSVPHTFTITDTNGDGLTSGYYALYVNGVEQFMGAAGSFTTEQTTQFPVAALPPLEENPGDGNGNGNGNGNSNGNGNTPSPSPPTGPPPFCFSGSSTVEVMDSQKQKLKDLKLGDRVHIGNGVYEPIYGFGHLNVHAKTDFLEIKTDKTTLQLTHDHMVFSSSGAVPASMVQIGDQLVDGQGENLLVKSIKTISSTGAIAPFTPSGKIVVDDVLASSFVAFGTGAHLSVAGINVSYQWLAHSFEFPHRFACNYLTQCLEETYTDAGVSHWVDAPHRLTLWMMAQNDLVRNLMSVLAVALFFTFNVLEFIVLHPVSIALGTYSVWKLLARRGAKQL